MKWGVRRNLGIYWKNIEGPKFTNGLGSHSNGLRLWENDATGLGIMFPNSWYSFRVLVGLKGFACTGVTCFCSWGSALLPPSLIVFTSSHGTHSYPVNSLILFTSSHGTHSYRKNPLFFSSALAVLIRTARTSY